MSKSRNWRVVKDDARRADPTWDAPERLLRRARMRAAMLASVLRSTRPDPTATRPDPAEHEAAARY